MAAASTPSPSFSPLFCRRARATPALRPIYAASSDSSSSSGEPPRKRRVDTRIHWSSPDEGWIGGKTKKPDSDNDATATKKEEEFLGERFADLIDKATTSHYQ